MNEQAWPADKVERRSVASLVPYARNARKHTAEQVRQLAASIKEWGWTVPVLVDEAGGIIAGHGRVLAAKHLGLAEVPVVVAVGWTETQKRAYMLADNQLALNSEWDADLLKVALSELQADDFDVSLAGFNPESETPDTDTLSAELEDVGIGQRFWIAVKGDLEHQAQALHALKALAALPGVEVTSNLAG